MELKNHLTKTNMLLHVASGAASALMENVFKNVINWIEHSEYTMTSDKGLHFIFLQNSRDTCNLSLSFKNLW